VLIDLEVYPVYIAGDIYINTWILVSTANSPGDYTSLDVTVVVVVVANQWRTSVTSASVFSLYSSSAHEGIM